MKSLNTGTLTNLFGISGMLLVYSNCSINVCQISLKACAACLRLQSLSGRKLDLSKVSALSYHWSFIKTSLINLHCLTLGNLCEFLLPVEDGKHCRASPPTSCCLSQRHNSCSVPCLHPLFPSPFLPLWSWTLVSL